MRGSKDAQDNQTLLQWAFGSGNKRKHDSSDEESSEDENMIKLKKKIRKLQRGRKTKQMLAMLDDDDDDDDDDVDDSDKILKMLQNDKDSKKSSFSAKCKSMFDLMKSKQKEDDAEDDNSGGTGQKSKDKDKDVLTDGDLRVVRLLLQTSYKAVATAKTWSEMNSTIEALRKPVILKILKDLQHPKLKTFIKNNSNTTRLVMAEAAATTLQKKVIATRS